MVQPAQRSKCLKCDRWSNRFLSIHSATHQKYRVRTVFIITCLIQSMGRITNNFHCNVHLWRQRSWIISSVRQLKSNTEFFSWYKLHVIIKIFTAQSHIKVIYNLILLAVHCTIKKYKSEYKLRPVMDRLKHASKHKEGLLHNQ
jgi:hypothetical protein